MAKKQTNKLKLVFRVGRKANLLDEIGLSYSISFRLRSWHNTISLGRVAFLPQGRHKEFSAVVWTKQVTISRGTLESLEFRRDDAMSKEFKRVIELDGHPCRIS